MTPDMCVIDRIAQVLASTGAPADVSDPADASANELHEAFPKGFVNSLKAQNCIGKQPQLMVRIREITTAEKG